MATHHIIQVAHPTGVEVTITYSYTAGKPAVYYLHNGDPGYPAESAEIDFIKVSPGGFESWAMSWLSDNEEMLFEEIESELENMAAEAAEMRRNY